MEYIEKEFYYGKKREKTVSKQDGIQYRHARTWQIAFAMLYGAGQMCLYMLMTYATYIGNSNFGILVGVTGVVITASRIFDGITDPICAYISGYTLEGIASSMMGPVMTNDPKQHIAKGGHS